MKKFLFALVAVLALLALVAVPSHTTLAAADATCVSDPSSGPVGTTFVITCWGYTPNSYVYAYLVEPSGAAGQLFFQGGAIKVDESGSISYVQASSFGTAATLGTGTWHFVAEETGLAKAVLHRGETTFTITGGTEGVSGAWLSASPSVLYKPEDAYGRFSFPPINVNFLNASEPATISGGGFAPNEIVSFWVEPPRGACSSFTDHLKADTNFVIPGLFGLHIREDLNLPIYDGIGAFAFDSVKADGGGNASTQAFFFSVACEGDWHFVARGNSSGWGGDTHLTVIGNPITTNATLTASPGTVTALFDKVWFSGSGFGANEHVTCWLTSPQGQTLSFPNALFFDISFPPLLTQKSRQLFSDGGGNISFDLVTGSIYYKIDAALVVTGVGSFNFEDTDYIPVASEGALGTWYMTCRGDSSGATAIAPFTITGGFVDP